MAKIDNNQKLSCLENIFSKYYYRDLIPLDNYNIRYKII